MKIFLLLLTLYFLLHTSVSAQSVSASLDRDKILLGEQVTLQFNLSNINDEASFVAAWPQINDTINHAEIVKHTSIDTINVNGTNTYQQNFTITSFDSGRWQLGPFTFVIQDKTTNKRINLATQPLYLTVLPVDVSSLKDYHPIKDIIDVETSFNWLPVIIASVIVLLAIITFIIIRNRRKKTKAAPDIILKGTPLERAVEKLQALKNDPLTSTTTIKKFHITTDIIIREYFQEIMKIKALQLTAAELFTSINVYMQDVALRKKFQQLFELNGAVKYAKYMPQPTESKSTLEEITKSLYQIDELINRAKNNADRMVSKY